MITYTANPFRPHDRQRIIVRLDKRTVGHINQTAKGWRYKPLTGKSGETFATLAEVKKSLEN